MREARPPLVRCWSAQLIIVTVCCAVVCGAAGGVGAADLPAAATPAVSPTANPPPAAQALSTAKPLQRYSLTVRGGVSLGAYEGGINWALLRVLQGDPSASLTTVTGASAGNINAFLSAVEWCQSPAHSAAESPRDNLFWKAWIPVGIHGLFPRGQRQGVRARRRPVRARGLRPGRGDAPAGARRRDAVSSRLSADRGGDRDAHSSRGHRHQVGRRAVRQRRDSHPHAAVRLDLRPRHGTGGAAVPAARRARPRDRRVPDAADEGERRPGERRSGHRHHSRLQRLPGRLRAAGDPPLRRGWSRPGPPARRLRCGGRPVHRRRRVRQRSPRAGGQPDGADPGHRQLRAGALRLRRSRSRAVVQQGADAAARAPGDQAGRPLDDLRLHLDVHRRLGAIRAADGRALPLQADRRAPPQRREAAALDAAPPTELALSSAHGLVPGPLRRVLRRALPRARLLRRRLRRLHQCRARAVEDRRRRSPADRGGGDPPGRQRPGLS